QRTEPEPERVVLEISSYDLVVTQVEREVVDEHETQRAAAQCVHALDARRRRRARPIDGRASLRACRISPRPPPAQGPTLKSTFQRPSGLCVSANGRPCAESPARGVTVSARLGAPLVASDSVPRASNAPPSFVMGPVSRSFADSSGAPTAPRRMGGETEMAKFEIV